MIKPSDDKGQRMDEMELLPEEEEIIELIDKVPAAATQGAFESPSASQTPEPSTDKLGELADRVYLSPSGVPMAQAANAALGPNDSLFDSLNLDEALRNFDEKQADARNGMEEDDDAGITVTLDDTLDMGSDILDLDSLEESTLAVEDEASQPFDTELADELLSELDSVLTEDDLPHEPIGGASARTTGDAAVIDLQEAFSDELSGVAQAPDVADLPPELDFDEDPTSPAQARSDDEILGNLGMAIAPAAVGIAAAGLTTPPEHSAGEIEMALSDEKLQRALVQAIKEVYAERIEALLIETIEKTVTQEIRRLKSMLLDEQDGETRG